MSEKRITNLDGVRGIAIILVVLFHTFARHPESIPWATEFDKFPIFKLGFLGVQLFFLISGFVIYMSLENSKSIGQFLLKRWLRLFPAMLIGTILLYGYFTIQSHSNNGALPKTINLFPGLLFLEPSWISMLMNEKVYPLEASFWSLFIEVKFYVFFGLAYFYFKKQAIYLLTISFLFSFFINTLVYCHMGQHIPWLIIDSTNTLKHFGWFASGAWFYLYFQSQHTKYYIASALVAAASSLYMGFESYYLGYGKGIGVSVGAFIIFLIFIISFKSQVFKSIFSSKFFIFFGFISYPLYLIHESMLVSFTIAIHSVFPGIPGLLTPIIPILILIFFTFLIAKYAEPLFRRFLLSLFNFNLMYKTP